MQSGPEGAEKSVSISVCPSSLQADYISKHQSKTFKDASSLELEELRFPGIIISDQCFPISELRLQNLLSQTRPPIKKKGHQIILRILFRLVSMRRANVSSSQTHDVTPLRQLSRFSKLVWHKNQLIRVLLHYYSLLVRPLGQPILSGLYVLQEE